MAHLLHPLGFVLFHCLGRFLETLVHGLLECATTPATNAKLLSAAERSGNAGAFALTTPVAYPRPPVLRRLRHGLRDRVHGLVRPVVRHVSRQPAAPAKEKKEKTAEPAKGETVRG